MSIALVAGGAGFIGSHLCQELLKRGDRVICMDDLSTGKRSNLNDIDDWEDFAFVPWDVQKYKDILWDLDVIYNLASPASPVWYQKDPVRCLLTNSMGTANLLELAERKGARFVLASTSEVYGNPLEHPQKESYWGNVDPVGPRAMYDEGKRFAEALTAHYGKARGVSVGIARIFNTYGPRMDPEDGRVVPNFMMQALKNEPITIHGDGEQTRSFCYVRDTVRGLIALADSDLSSPVNIGSRLEMTINQLAATIISLTKSESTLTYEDRPAGDPDVRRPVTDKAHEELGWQSEIKMNIGLMATARYYKNLIEDEQE